MTTAAEPATPSPAKRARGKATVVAKTKLPAKPPPKRLRRAAVLDAGIVAQEYAAREPIDGVAPHPDNDNAGDIPAIRASIRANKFFGALYVQRSTRFILAGNHSWKAAKLEGLTHVPVIWLDVDDASALEILAVDNETAAHATRIPERTLSLIEKVIAARGAKFAPEALGRTTKSLDALRASVRDAQAAKLAARPAKPPTAPTPPADGPAPTTPFDDAPAEDELDDAGHPSVETGGSSDASEDPSEAEAAAGPSRRVIPTAIMLTPLAKDRWKTARTAMSERNESDAFELVLRAVTTVLDAPDGPALLRALAARTAHVELDTASPA